MERGLPAGCDRGPDPHAGGGDHRAALLIDNGAMGLALVVGLLFLFLNARTALWVAAGIPVACRGDRDHVCGGADL